jgi:hypothetical protein
MKRNSTSSPLLRLPAELRNQIYEYVFGGRRQLIKPLGQHQQQSATTEEAEKGEQSNANLRPTNLSLLSTSRQLHLKTALLPYKLNTWVIDSLAGLYHLVNFSYFQRLAMHNAMRTLELHCC